VWRIRLQVKEPKTTGVERRIAVSRKNGAAAQRHEEPEKGGNMFQRRVASGEILPPRAGPSSGGLHMRPQRQRVLPIQVAGTPGARTTARNQKCRTPR